MSSNVPSSGAGVDDASRSHGTELPASEALDAAIASGLRVIRQQPLNAETPVAALAAAVTPTSQVYVRTNFGIPDLDARTHRVQVSGSVAEALSLGIAELAELGQSTVAVTMECAGNDRTAIVPPVSGEPWTGGAVSTVRWSGVPLRAVLERVRVGADAINVLFEGEDHGTVEGVAGDVRFARTLPLADALHPDTLLATHMNGAPLTPRYGAPVRLVVPGWFGMASVKWLRRIEVLTTPFRGHFQARRYVYTDGRYSTPVTRMRVKSLIVAPAADAIIPPGMTRVWGWAWSGEGAISAVDVCEKSTADWQPARLDVPESRAAWTRWEADLDLCGDGPCVLRSRARDTAGNVQPEHPPWNALGYGNNAIREATVHLTAPPRR